MARGNAGAKGGLIAAWRRDKTANKRRDKLCGQLPLALQSMGFALDVGYALPQAFQQAADAVDEPLKSELMGLVWDFDAGVALDEALERLLSRTGIEELELLGLGFAVQHRSGGSMRNILQSCSSSMKNRFALKRDLQVQTAQARMSAKIVSLLPPVLFVLLALLSPDYVAPFLGSSLGLAMLLLALALDGAGVLMIRRILDCGV